MTIEVYNAVIKIEKSIDSCVKAGQTKGCRNMIKNHPVISKDESLRTFLLLKVWDKLRTLPDSNHDTLQQM